MIKICDVAMNYTEECEEEYEELLAKRLAIYSSVFHDKIPFTQEEMKNLYSYEAIRSIKSKGKKDIIIANYNKDEERSFVDMVANLNKDCTIIVDVGKDVKSPDKDILSLPNIALVRVPSLLMKEKMLTNDLNYNNSIVVRHCGYSGELFSYSERTNEKLHIGISGGDSSYALNIIESLDKGMLDSMEIGVLPISPNPVLRMTAFRKLHAILVLEKASEYWDHYALEVIGTGAYPIISAGSGMKTILMECGIGSIFNNNSIENIKSQLLLLYTTWKRDPKLLDSIAKKISQSVKKYRWENYKISLVSDITKVITTIN